jgi:hypothetical protein
MREGTESGPVIFYKLQLIVFNDDRSGAEPKKTDQASPGKDLFFFQRLVSHLIPTRTVTFSTT